MPPLFDNRGYDEPAEEFRAIKHAESAAMEVLRPLRREAAMGEKAANCLRELAKDRAVMVAELRRADSAYAELLSSLGVRCPPQMIVLPRVPTNPFSWTDEIKKQEEDRMWKWKAHRNVVQQVALLAKSSMQAVTVPEDAFDELGSDI